jgi:hypothetical protein
MVLAVVLAGCEGGSDEGEDTPATDAAVPPDTSQLPNTAAPPGGTAAAEQHIQVENPMPHAMMVMSHIGGGMQQLGTVAAKGTGSFVVQVPRGTNIVLMAHDSANSHTVSGTVVAADTLLRWVIRDSGS